MTRRGFGPAAGGAIVALGFRARTGRASAVALAGPVSAPRVVVRAEVPLHDPGHPFSRFPFHAGLDRPGAAGRRAVARAVAAARAAAVVSIGGFVAPLRARGAAVVAASATDPATIANPHMRAHAEEGQIFPALLAEALNGLGIPVARALERDLETLASAALGTTVPAIRRELARMGKETGPPWRALEKSAALAAWIVLARGVSGLRASRKKRPPR